MRLPQVHEALGLAVRQWAQQRGVDHGEDRRVGADADHQREQHDDGEPRLTAEHSRREAQVAPEVRPPFGPIAPRGASAIDRHELAAGFADIAELAERLLSRVGGTRAASHQLLGAHVEVKSEFLIDLCLHTPGAGELEDAAEPRDARSAVHGQRLRWPRGGS
jgi:hypothetical protein